MKRLFIALCLILLLSLIWCNSFAQEQLTVVSWNAESGDADSAVVANRIAEFDGVDIWGICEVKHSWASTFESAAEVGENADFGSVLGTTGRGDRLLIIYDSDRLELLDHEELDAINPQNRVRSPLVGHFRLAASGDEFLFMVNHLYRTNDNARHLQSEQLNDWAEHQTLPIIAVGDFNYDWRVEGGDTNHDRGYDLLTEDGVFEWVRPDVLVRTQYSRSYPPSVLDFVFLANEEGAISGSSKIVVADGDLPDNNDTPDHRPVLAELTFGAGVTPAAPVVSLRQQLLNRIAAIDRELADLRTLVEGM